MSNKNKSVLNSKFIALSSVITLGIMAVISPINTFANQSNMTKIVGTFEATLLDVKIPAITTFIYNPNTEKMNSNHINIISQTNAPIYFYLDEINISEESGWKPNLVAPDKYTKEEWRNLTTKQSQKEIALGLKVLENNQWLYELEKINIWDNDQKIGTIKNKGEVHVQPILEAGNSIPTEELLKTNYIFEFGIEPGIPIIKEKLEIKYEETKLNTNTEEIFASLESAYSPIIIGDELFAVDYFDSTKIYVYDTNTQKLKRVLSYASQQKVSGNASRFYSLGTDGEHLLAFRSTNVIDIIDKQTGKIIENRTLNKAVQGGQGLIGSVTFTVHEGYLYVTPIYSSSMYIYDYETGRFIKEIGGFNSTSGVSIRNEKLVVLERFLKQINVFDLSDALNPIKEGTLKLENNYDNVGLAMDDNYTYIATYQKNKIIRYPLITE